MGNDKELLDKSRSQLRSKRRKTNIILNALIAIVLLLIVIVSVNIFGGNDHNNGVEEVASTVNDEQEQKNEKNDDRDEEEPSNREEDDTDIDQTEVDESTAEDEDEEESTQDELIVQEGGTDPNVIKSIIDPAWEPVGTTQNGSPAQNYVMSGVDWQEMVAAISYATGFDESKGDILYRLGNNGPKSSVATIKKRETNQKFRVYIDWVDGQGWQPVLVEELIN